MWFSARALVSVCQLRFTNRFRHYWNNMDIEILQPPESVRGMLQLNRNDFRKLIEVPRLLVKEENSNKIMPLVKKLLLKMEKLRPVRPAKVNGDQIKLREILLHPLPVKCWEDLPSAELESYNVTKDDYSTVQLELGYDNWRADEIFRSILPLDNEGLTSYSRIGHIVHLNLRDHLLPYKQLIGEVLRDKVAGCTTVVNKASTIDNTYRNFQLELICGEPMYKVKTRENGIVFEFDFSKVYWNPRLSTEHERIVQLLNAGDVLYDVFAGVGPFSVPAARKGCIVFANDLNPESFKWLEHNMRCNKCSKNVQLFNKDGREFINKDLKENLLKIWLTDVSANADCTIHITMNLPAMAVEFLGEFCGLFADHEMELENLKANKLIFPIVHVYCFAKGDDTKTLALQLVEENLGLPLNERLMGIHFVRNVAPNKDMYRVTFRLDNELLFWEKPDNNRKRILDDIGNTDCSEAKITCS